MALSSRWVRGLDVIRDRPGSGPAFCAVFTARTRTGAVVGCLETTHRARCAAHCDVTAHGAAHGTRSVGERAARLGRRGRRAPVRWLRLRRVAMSSSSSQSLHVRRRSRLRRRRRRRRRMPHGARRRRRRSVSRCCVRARTTAADSGGGCGRGGVCRVVIVSSSSCRRR